MSVLPSLIPHNLLADRIQVLFAAVAVPVYVFMIPSFDPRPGVSYKTRFQQLDYLGTTLMVGASIAGVMAINFGGRIYPWDSGQTIALFVVSGVLFVIFAWQQWNCVLTTLKNRTFPCQFLKRLSFLNLVRLHTPCLRIILC